MSRSLLRDYSSSFTNPAFWMYASWLEIVTKYRRSRLGLLWMLVPPTLYAFGVGGFFANITGKEPRDFIPHMLVGYLIFRLVTVSLSNATTAYSAHANFILDGRTRLTDYSLRVIANAVFYLLVSVPILVFAMVYGGKGDPIGILTSMLSMVVVMLNIGWMVVLVAILGARLPDVHQLIGSILMFAFLFTPIIWQASDTPLGTLRGSIARINPLFHLVEVVRAPLLGEPVEHLTLTYLVLLTLSGWLAAFVIYRRYAKYVPIWI